MPLLLAVLATLYATRTLLKLKSEEICIQRVWNGTNSAIAVDNTASFAVGAVLAGAAGKSDPLLFACSAGIALAALAGCVVYIMLMPSEPPDVYFPKTGARDCWPRPRAAGSHLIPSFLSNPLRHVGQLFCHERNQRREICGIFGGGLHRHVHS
jgi:hypothetical protein